MLREALTHVGLRGARVGQVKQLARATCDGRLYQFSFGIVGISSRLLDDLGQRKLGSGLYFRPLPSIITGNLIAVRLTALRTITWPSQSPGLVTLSWDGKSDNGMPVRTR